MTDLIVPLIIAAAGLTWLVVFLCRRAAAELAIERLLTDRGFVRLRNDADLAIDFTVTLQWPETRGITTLKQFTKEEAGSTLTVADVRCPEVTGARMGRSGAAMKPDRIRHTVIGCSFPGRELPSFYLCPQDWADQFRNLYEGGTEITTGDAAFDSAFFVIGPGGQDVAPVLTQRVRAEMCSLSNVMIASGNNSLLLFRQAAVLPPPELARFLDVIELIREEIIRGAM